jgi:hypothetical protein
MSLNCAKFTLLLLGLVGADKSIEAAGVTVKVKGQSGKMTLTLPKGNGTQDVEVTMDALRQLNSAGETLGSGGNQKHSFNSFATQEFTFGAPEETTYKELKVAKVAFESTMVGTSKLKIDTYIFKEDGSFMVGDDNVTVAAGSVKFNVEFSSWSWCGADSVVCNQDGDGASVELDITVKGEGEASGSGKNVDLGDAKLMMLNTYSDDDGSTWKEMPAGYPKMNGNTFTIQIPKFDGKVIYDPIVTGESPDDDKTDSAAAAGALVPLMLMLLCFAQ